MFQSCYRGRVPIPISLSAHQREPSDGRRVQARLRSYAFDIGSAVSGQFSDPIGLNRIDDILAVAHTCRGIGLHQTDTGKKFEVSIQAGSTDIQHSLQLSNSRRAEHRQAAQDIYPSAVAHKTYSQLNFGWQFWPNQAWHASILPDATENQCLPCRHTLLVSNRVCNGPILRPS
jgi:hypothetical protein